MGFEIHGLDDAIKMTEEAAHGLTVHGMNVQCAKVKQAARECGVIENELVLEAEPRGKEWDLKFELKDGSKIGCVKQAIEKTLPSMPVTSRGVFEEFLKQLEQDHPKSP